MLTHGVGRVVARSVCGFAGNGRWRWGGSRERERREELRARGITKNPDSLGLLLTHLGCWFSALPARLFVFYHPMAVLLMWRFWRFLLGGTVI
jgi:hypothetical protein